jgi:hypothetical protein
VGRDAAAARRVTTSWRPLTPMTVRRLAKSNKEKQKQCLHVLKIS